MLNRAPPLFFTAPCLQAITSTRKGNKKLAIYDLKITMKWEAKAEDDEEQVSATDAAWQALGATAAGCMCSNAWRTANGICEKRGSGAAAPATTAQLRIGVW
jgi:hypothetical protein